MLFLILGFMLAANAARAQWTVIDPSNLTQGIINSTNEMVNTSATAENMLQNFQETVKIYQQAKAYYDKLQAVSDPVRSARKIQKCILLVGEISGIYVNNYEKMLADKNFFGKGTFRRRARIYADLAGKHYGAERFAGRYYADRHVYDRQRTARQDRRRARRTHA